MEKGGKGGSWGNSTLVVGGIDAPGHDTCTDIVGRETKKHGTFFAKNFALVGFHDLRDTNDGPCVMGADIVGLYVAGLNTAFSTVSLRAANYSQLLAIFKQAHF